MIKWIQLDLARQMESIPVLEEFIGIMAEAGYNGILLYLEDRIRTKSYPYPKDNECYTPEQIKKLVAFAKKKNIELVPCVATLGHAERFLRHPEMQYLAELQGDMKGRFGGSSKDTFCPTHPKFYAFMEKYLTEVAALFPSKFFHAGLDEFFNYALCPRCKKVAPDVQGESDLFVSHIKKIHAILAKLGKRMMMWSDMFEIYKDAITKIPNDIVMYDWQYQPDVRFYLGHLLDCEVEDRFALNEKLGLDCVIAPVDFTLSNMTSSLKFAEGQKSCLGYVLTNWEKSDAFLLRYMPQYVFAGLFINGMDEDKAYSEMMRKLFGTNDPSLKAALRLIYTNGFYRHFGSVSDGTLFTRDFYGMPYASQEIDFGAYDIINARLSTVKTAFGKRILDDLLDAIHEKLLSHKLKRLYHDALDGHQLQVKQIQALHKEYLALLKAVSEKWDVNRSGVLPNKHTEALPGLKKKLASQLDTLRNSAFLKLRVCLPDGYGVQTVRVSLRCKGEWHTISSSVIKPNKVETALAETFMPCDKKLLDADAIKIESFGMGGIGICWAELGKLVPNAILAVHGIVEHPENLLDNDVKFSWFGSQSTRDDYFDKNRAQAVQSVTLSLAKR